MIICIFQIDYNVIREVIMKNINDVLYRFWTSSFYCQCYFTCFSPKRGLITFSSVHQIYDALKSFKNGGTVVSGWGRIWLTILP